jgi:murein peptide amidase A
MSIVLPTYQDIAQRWKRLRTTRDVRVREVACVGAARTLLCAEMGDSAAPAVHLSAGVHGDEPAGVLALLDVVEAGELDPQFSYRIWPCTNPTGFDARTRESADGIDINRTFGRGGTSPEAKAIVMSNRDRKFIAAIDLHEDDGAREAYCYEYGTRVIGERVAPQCLCPDPEQEAETIGGLSLSLLLRRGAAEHVLTLETPAHEPLEARAATHVHMLKETLAILRQS